MAKKMAVWNPELLERKLKTVMDECIFWITFSLWKTESLVGASPATSGALGAGGGLPVPCGTSSW